MKLTTGTIVAAECCGTGAKRFTVETSPNADIKLGDFVSCLSNYRVEEGSLWALVRYMEDRPALISDKEVREGINAIRMFLEHTIK